MKRGLFLAALLCIGAASDPSERLADPTQEARARTLFRDVRCLVCQNESIDDSEAELAHDLRQIVREQVRAGATDAQVKTFLTERYGEFVLLTPARSAGNLMLWIGPFLVVLLGAGLLVVRLRRPPQADELSPAEAERVRKLSAASEP